MTAEAPRLTFSVCGCDVIGHRQSYNGSLMSTSPVLIVSQFRVAGQLVDSLVRIAALHAVPCLLQLDYWLGESSKDPSRLYGLANR